MSTKCIATQIDTPSIQQPWQSWGSTARYLIVRLAQAVPTGLCVWLAYLRH
jgi:hypothetical protein